MTHLKFVKIMSRSKALLKGLRWEAGLVVLSFPPLSRLRGKLLHGAVGVGNRPMLDLEGHDGTVHDVYTLRRCLPSTHLQRHLWILISP